MCGKVWVYLFLSRGTYWVIPWEVRRMNTQQKALLVGMILGDAYLQKTGKNNARIRLEHSQKQFDYLVWKAQQFPEFFQGKPEKITRFNPIYKKTYAYERWQSYASPEIGKYQRLFYDHGKKIIPDEFNRLFVHPRSLAVWFMDDGYLYHRDKMGYLYIPKLSSISMHLLLKALQSNFGLHPTVKVKKRGNSVLVFSVKETEKLLRFITPFIIPSMRYKLLDPVSTEA